MSVKLRWDGLHQFRTALRNLPADLNDDAQAIVVSHATEAERLIKSAYPEKTGNLKRGVNLTVETGRFGTVAKVGSRAFHSHLFEKGTVARKTSTGANRGRMPAAPESQQMIPIVVRVRRRMVAQLIAMVQRTGLVVTSS
jgi:hypothetical protein